jgi:hypothetical protein
MQKTPTSTLSLPLSGKFSSVLHPPALLFQRITSLTPQTSNPLQRAKMLLLHSLPSIPNHVLAPLDRCSRDLRPRLSLRNPLLDARGLLPHPFGTLFHHAHRPRLRGYLSHLLHPPPLSIVAALTRPPRRREPLLGTPPRLLLHYLHPHHSLRKSTAMCLSQWHFIPCPVLNLNRSLSRYALCHFFLSFSFLSDVIFLFV